jgi:tetratricopeptide (TPR) repeat protein
VLTVVGLLALAPFRRAPLAAALAASPNALRKPLGELVRYGLLARDEAGYTASHALVHTYARACCLPESGAIARLTTYYDALAREECAKGLVGYRRLDAERAHMMRVLASCVDRERWKAARSLVWAVRDYLDLQGYWTESARALELGIQAAQAGQARYDESAFLNSLGLTYAALGQVERAIDYYKQALAISHEIGDRRGEGNKLGNLGLAYADLGQVERAIDYYEQALPISREIGDRRGEGNRLGNLGLAYAALGQVERAIDYYEQALAIGREIGDRRGEGADLGNLGNAYADLGQVERARECLRQALAIFEEIKSPYAEQVRGSLEQLDAQ